MARKPRQDIAGSIHHVYARGIRRAALFIDDADHQRYLRMLGRATRRYGWLCLSYCLMPNHVHLLIETTSGNLGAGMSWLHGGYAKAFNDRHGLEGHVFQGRYGATRIVTDAHLLTAVRYITRNPIEAGLSGTAGGWPWSSHAAVETDTAPPWLAHARLLELLSGGCVPPAERYAELVLDGNLKVPGPFI